MACLLLWTTHDLSRLPPGQQLPRQSSPNDAVLARDITCRITNRAEVTETAHLIPRSEERWFRENGMFQYTQPPKPGTDSLEDARNAILLKSDVHTLFDQKRLLIVPKLSTFVVHILAPGLSSELLDLFHNVPVQQLTGISKECMFGRFA
jgi:hypothetical protein